MNAHPISLARPWLSPTALNSISDTLSSGWLGYGPRCAELEMLFCARRAGWALATQSCTAALWTVAMLLRTGKADEVIVPANTYIACAAAFQMAGWHVQVCDVDPKTGFLDLDDADRTLTSTARALLIVDVYGQRFPERAAAEFCARRGLTLIRDAAHRLDIDDEEPPAADFVCYSFGPTKEIASPDGGLVWSRVGDLEHKARALTLWGLSKDTWGRSRHLVHAPISVNETLGLKLRQNDLNAGIILDQFPDRIAQRIKRAELYECYRRMLDARGILLEKRASDDSYLMVPLFVAATERRLLRERLAAANVATSDHYPSLAELLPAPQRACPNAGYLSSRVITLPMHLYLSETDIFRIANAIGRGV
jgi:dTDP-4-amino-4,6-dideoxygalactose transaminase